MLILEKWLRSGAKFHKNSQSDRPFKRYKLDKIKSFFAPNHTYDLNTFKALKANGIDYVIDGYGLKPYSEFEINFIPQLFYKEIMLPFGIQTTQVHLNYMSNENFLNFVSFIKKNSSKIINLTSTDITKRRMQLMKDIGKEELILSLIHI
mgnify:CR=1 FL=1